MSNRFDTLIDHWDERLRQAFLDSVNQMRNAAQIEQIARMLEKGDVNGALRAVGLDPTAFRAFDKTFEAAFEAGGIATAKILPPARATDGARIIVQFNIRNPAAEQWLRDHSSKAVAEILDDQRQMVRNVLQNGMQRGLNPRAVALDLVGRVDVRGFRRGGLIGLTESQAEWVRNYADELASDNPAKVLERTLRDKRFDRAVLKAADTKQPIPADLRQAMVAAYKNRALRFRAEALARTEAMAALHQSQEEAMKQAVGKGAVAESTVSFVWRTAHDNRVRDTHRSMDGQVRKMGVPFTSGSGASLRFPGDPFGPASEIINCRCFREPKVDFLSGVD